jgi:hypothetical protein
VEERFGPLLRPLFRLFKVSTFEALVKKVLWYLFAIALLTPLVLIPIYYFFTTLL